MEMILREMILREMIPWDTIPWDTIPWDLPLWEKDPGYAPVRRGDEAGFPEKNRLSGKNTLRQGLLVTLRDVLYRMQRR